MAEHVISRITLPNQDVCILKDSGAARNEHTHDILITTTAGVTTTNLSANTQYQITAGGSNLTFKTPYDNDFKVKQTNTNTNGVFPLLFGYQVNENETTNQVYKAYPSLTYNPSTKELNTGGKINGYTLAAAAAKAVTTTITSTSDDLPTAAAVASFVEGKGYTTNTGTVTNVATGSGLTGGPITTTGTISIATSGVTNDMLAGSIDNNKLTNSTISIAGSTVSLGGSITADTLRTNLGLSTAMHFRGIATVAITDGSTTNPTIDGYDFSKKEAGDVIIDSVSSYEYVWSGSAWERLGPDGSYKTIQTAVSDPTAGSSGQINFINTISQDTNGVITATKQPVRIATTSQTGVIQITKDNANSFLNQLDTGSSTPVDNDYYISQYVSGGTTTTTYHRRPMSALWTYIKSKTDLLYNNYSHPTGDGNLHVPATETTNNGKFLKAGSTAGSLSWATAVTSVGTGVGLTGGSITTTGTIKAKLRSETALGNDSSAAAEVSNRVYPVAVDKSGYLAVNVPWTNVNNDYLTGITTTVTGSGNAITAVEVSGSTITFTKGATYNNYSHPTSSGNKHIPSGGSSGQFLGWSADGTATWVANPNTNTTYTLSGALASHKFSSTLTPSSGSATTADITFAAGTNISLTDDTSNRKITINNTYSLPIAKYNTLGGLKPAYSSTGTVTLTTSAAENSTTPTIAAKSTTSNRYYAVEVDTNGVPFVNVPWTNINNNYLTGITTTTSSTSGNVVTGITASGSTITYTLGSMSTSGHTHDISLAADTGTSSTTLAHGGKYKLTAGGNSVIFTLPSDNNTTYTISSGANNGQITVTPSSGDAYNVSVTGLGTAAYTSAGTFSTAGHTHTTSLTTGGSSPTSLGASTTYTLTAGGTSIVFKTPPNTWNAMGGATSAENGTVGYINATPPKDGYNTKYWRADGTWAIPPDTNKYHTSGSWNNFTYTATNVGGAGDLAFTIPTGTSSTQVAVGNHNHNSTYVAKTDGVTAVSWADGSKTLTRTVNGTAANVVSFLTLGGLALSATTTSLTVDGSALQIEIIRMTS